jgi:uncharacterized membrane protein YciS (DUF1049 family)
LLWTLGLAVFVGALWTGWSFRSGNSGPVDLDLIWMQVPNVELWRVILIALGLGVVLAGVLVGFAWLRARLLNRRYRSTIRRLESELHQMRSLPLSGSEDEPIAVEPMLSVAERS